MYTPEWWKERKHLEQLKAEHRATHLWHESLEGETLFTLASDYGLVHWQAIWDHDCNRELRERRGHPHLLVGDIVFIPKSEPPGQICQPRTRYQFKLRPYGPLPPLSDEHAKRCARRLAGEAYQRVEKRHELSARRAAEGALFNAWHYKRYRIAAKGGVIVAGAATAITLGILTGGVGIPVAAAMAAGLFTVKKLIDRTAEYQNGKKLRKYWEKPEYEYKPEFVAPGRGRDDKQEVMSGDAADAIRKSVLHLREANRIRATELAEHFITPEANQVDGKTYLRFPTDGLDCEGVVNHVKSSMKFLHHLNKMRNYLLPVANLGVFFLDLYEEFSQDWATIQPDTEAKIVAHMKTGSHEGCVPAGSKAAKAGFTCYRGATLSIDTLLDEKGLGTGRAARAVKGYTGAGRYTQVSVRALDLADVRSKLVDLVSVQQERVRSFHQKFDTEKADLAKGFGTGAARHEQLLRDVYGRYEDPSFFRQVRHKVRNNYKSTTASEKFACLLEDSVSLVGDAIGGAFLGDWVGQATVASGDLASRAATGGTSLGLAGLAKLTEAGTEFVTFRMGARETMMNSDLLHFDANRIGRAIEEIHEDEKEQGAREGELKQGAVVAERLFRRMAIHATKAAETAKALSKREYHLTNCADALALAEDLYLFHHDIDKMERYLVAGLSLTFELYQWEQALMKTEEEILASLANPTLRWVVGDGIGFGGTDFAKDADGKPIDSHQTCREKGGHCYGPKVTTPKGGVATMDREQVHRPL